MAEKFAVPGAEESTGFGTFAPGAGPAFLGGGTPIGTGEGTVAAGPTFLTSAPTTTPYDYAYPTGEPATGYLAPTAGPVVTVPTGYETPTGYVVPTGYGYEPTQFYPPGTPPTVSGGVVIVVGGTLTVTSSTTSTFRVYASDGQTYTGVTTFDLTRTYVHTGGTFTVTGGALQFSSPGAGVLVLHGAGGVQVTGTFTVTAGPVGTVPTDYGTPTGQVVPIGYGYEPTQFFPPETPPTVSGGVVIVVGGTLTVTSPTTATFRVYAGDGRTYTGVTTFDLTATNVGAGGTWTVTGGTMRFTGPSAGTLVLYGSGGIGAVGTFRLSGGEAAIGTPTPFSPPPTGIGAPSAIGIAWTSARPVGTMALADIGLVSTGLRAVILSAMDPMVVVAQDPESAADEAIRNEIDTIGRTAATVSRKNQYGSLSDILTAWAGCKSIDVIADLNDPLTAPDVLVLGGTAALAALRARLRAFEDSIQGDTAAQQLQQKQALVAGHVATIATLIATSGREPQTPTQPSAPTVTDAPLGEMIGWGADYAGIPLPTLPVLPSASSPDYAVLYETWELELKAWMRKVLQYLEGDRKRRHRIPKWARDFAECTMTLAAVEARFGTAWRVWVTTYEPDWSVLFGHRRRVGSMGL